MLGFSKWSLSLWFPHQKPVYASPLPHARYMPRPSHSSRFYDQHNRCQYKIVYIKYFICTCPALWLVWCWSILGYGSFIWHCLQRVCSHAYKRLISKLLIHKGQSLWRVLTCPVLERVKKKIKVRVWGLFGTAACRPIVPLPPMSSPHSEASRGATHHIGTRDLCQQRRELSKEFC